MPTYPYRCTTCSHEFEKFQAFTDDALTECPECGGPLRKVWGSVGVVFKGSGFYRNDSRSGSGSSAGGSSDKSSSSGSSESSGSSGSSESTPAASSSSSKASSSSGSSGSSGSSSSSGSSTSSSGAA